MPRFKPQVRESGGNVGLKIINLVFLLLKK